MRRHPEDLDQRGSPLPLRATGIVLGAWIAILLTLAFVFVPVLFATCAAPAGTP